MIYPATLDITILQNSTFRTVFRALQKQKKIITFTVSGGAPFFGASCHGLEDGDKVVIVPAGESEAQFPNAQSSEPPSVPCGLELNRVYFVIASGLTANLFTVSATLSGSAISVADTPLASGMCIAEPLDLTGYSVDADLIGLISENQVATFSGAIQEPADGLVSVSMPPSTSSGIEAGQYGWDVSLTSGAGERYYWLTGVATVQQTYSRNT